MRCIRKLTNVSGLHGGGVVDTIARDGDDGVVRAALLHNLQLVLRRRAGEDSARVARHDIVPVVLRHVLHVFALNDLQALRRLVLLRQRRQDADLKKKKKKRRQGEEVQL